MQPSGVALIDAQRTQLALIDELRRLTVEHLTALPEAIYPRVERALDDALRAATERGMGLGAAQRDELLLLKLLRQRSATHAMRFRAQLGALFDPIAGKYGFDEDEDVGLRLVEEGELDFRLSGERMAESLAQAQPGVVEQLGLHFKAIAAALGRPNAVNPVAPDRLVAAFVHTFRDADLSPGLREQLLEQFGTVLGEALPGLYRSIEALLRTTPATPPVAGFALDMVPARQDQAPAMAVAESPPARSPAAQQSIAAGAEPAEWFKHPTEAGNRHAQLLELLHAWRNNTSAGPLGHGNASVQGQQAVGNWHATGTGAPVVGMPVAGAGAASAGASNASIDADTLGRVAELVQAEPHEPFVQALAGGQRLHEAIREHMGAAARRLGVDLDRSKVSRADADAIDLVGMLFEALALAEGVKPEARGLFARLVMTYVRIALRDEQLFLRPGHPGKRLIDAVAQSVEDNPGLTRHDRELIELAERQVMHVAAEFNEDMTILETATNELQPLLQQQRRTAELVERRSRESAQGRERLLQARNAAAVEVARRVSGRSLTPAVSRFLSRYWRHHYEQALLRAGADSPQVLQADELADALVELDALATSPEHPDVADWMLALLPQLSQCLADSGLDPGAVEDGLAQIARAIAFPDLSRQVQALTPVPAEADTGAGAALADPATIARMRVLRSGDMLRLQEFDGGLQTVKVAWISDTSGRVLLVDRRGQRKMLASPEQLAALAAQGRLQIGRDESPFDRALRDVQERLGKPTAQ